MSVFENQKLSLTAKPIPGGNRPPVLKADLYKGNPQLLVFTGIKKGEGVTFIRAGLEPKTCGLMCEIIRALAERSIERFKNSNNTPRNVESTETVKIECKQGKEREHVADIVIGVKPDGKMFICLVDKKNHKAPIIEFYFNTDLYHPISANNIEGFTPELVSALAAKSWAERTNFLWMSEMINNPPEKAEQKQNSGGYNNNNQNSSDNSFESHDW